MMCTGKVKLQTSRIRQTEKKNYQQIIHKMWKTYVNQKRWIKLFTPFSQLLKKIFLRSGSVINFFKELLDFKGLCEYNRTDVSKKEHKWVDQKSSGV